MVRDDPSNADKRAQTDAESIRDYVTTRRRLLAGTAGIGATMLAGCQGSDSGEASTETATAMDTDTPDRDGDRGRRRRRKSRFIRTSTS